MSHARALLPCLLALAATGAATGCGTSADRDQARAAAERLYQAAHRDDGATACAQLAPDLRAQLVEDEPGSRCATAIRQLTLHGDRADRVRVYATSAEVRFAGGDTVFLGDTAQGWRVEALGCQPAGPGPFECEAQS
jgi:hypothetical protein